MEEIKLNLRASQTRVVIPKLPFKAHKPSNTTGLLRLYLRAARSFRASGVSDAKNAASKLAASMPDEQQRDSPLINSVMQPAVARKTAGFSIKP